MKELWDCLDKDQRELLKSRAGSLTAADGAADGAGGLQGVARRHVQPDSPAMLLSRVMHAMALASGVVRLCCPLAGAVLDTVLYDRSMTGTQMASLLQAQLNAPQQSPIVQRLISNLEDHVVGQRLASLSRSHAARQLSVAVGAARVEGRLQGDHRATQSALGGAVLAGGRPCTAGPRAASAVVKLPPVRPPPRAKPRTAASAGPRSASTCKLPPVRPVKQVEEPGWPHGINGP